MRLYSLYALLAVMPAVSWCERPNAQFCDIDTPCLSGRRCDLTTNRCLELGDGGGCVAAACSAQAPVCDQDTQSCRACLPGEDALCAARSPMTPRCLGPTCVECLPPGGGSALETGECVRPDTSTGTSYQVCDPSSRTCRPCQLHSECASHVCAKDPDIHGFKLPQGSCVPQAQVLVVDPSQCSNDGPVYCRPNDALSKMSLQQRFLLIRQSAMPIDFSELMVGTLATQGVDLYIISPMGDTPPSQWVTPPPVQIGASSRRGFAVSAQNRVTIEGMLITGSSTGIQCYGTGAGDSQVRVVRSVLAGNALGLDMQRDCTLEMEQSWVGRWPGRCSFGILPPNQMSLNVDQSSFDIVNSVFTDNGDVGLGSFGGIQMTTGLGSRPAPSTIVDTTFFGQVTYRQAPDMHRYTTLYCAAAPNTALVVMNSLMFQNPQAPVLQGLHVSPLCGTNMLGLGTDDMTLMSYGVVLPTPGFRDVANRDFHLLLGAAPSPAQVKLKTGGAQSTSVTLGSKTWTVTAPAIDMDGQQRPGGSIAVGAFQGDGAPLACP